MQNRHKVLMSINIGPFRYFIQKYNNKIIFMIIMIIMIKCTLNSYFTLHKVMKKIKYPMYKNVNIHNIIL